MSISNRILAGFAAILLLMGVLGLFGLWQLAGVRNATELIVSRDIAFIRQVAEIRAGRNGMQNRSEAVLLEALLPAAARTQALAEWRAETSATQTALQKASAMAEQYAAASLSSERATTWSRISQNLNTATQVLAEITARNQASFTASARGDMAQVTEIRASLDPYRSQFEALLKATEAQVGENIAYGQDKVRNVYRLSRLSTLVGLVLSVLLGASIALLVRRSITAPLHQFMGFVERVGRGDLGGAPAASGRDEIGQLGANLNAMVEGLKDLAGQTREATENLNAAAAEIRASTQEQAASVEEQLAALQETAATVDEITHSGAQIGKRAQEVIATAQATAQTSGEGLRAVDETSRAMDLIREQAETVAENIVALSGKTQAIGDIIATVNDISERSHLLALNAAIEAASAGEHGRSFAVVASEMKMLADQAKEATAQVRSILGDIQRGINASVMLTEEAVKRVGLGKTRVDTTQRTITEITARVQEGVQTFQQIVASTNQQQLGIEQVMGALQNIRQASQQTAAGTRQLDEAAANLSGLSRDLVTLVERYRI